MAVRVDLSGRLAALPLIGFVYILFRPVSNGQILLPLLVALAITGLAVGISGRHRIARPLLVFFMVQMLFGTTFALVGASNPGIGDQIATFLGFPIAFWMMIYGINEKMLARVMWAAAIGCILVATTLILFIGSQQGILPQILPASFLQSQTDAFFTSTRVGRSGNSVRFFGLATLAAGAPIWVASVLIPQAKLLPPIRIRVVAAVTCTVAALISGRQAILVTTILAPLFLWVVSLVIGRQKADRSTLSRARLGRARRRRLGLILGTVAGILAVGRVALDSSPASGDQIQNAFQTLGSAYLGTGSVESADTVVRREEAGILLAGFRAHPWFGNGFGATFPYYRRDEDKPWDFELQYHMLLFNTGLLGVLFALVAAATLIHAARRAAQVRPDLAGCLAVTTVGCLAMLAAAASNPYLQAPGYNWALYLPIVVINVALSSVPSGAPPGDDQRLRSNTDLSAQTHTR